YIQGFFYAIDMYIYLHSATSIIALLASTLDISFLYSDAPLELLPKYNSSDRISQASIIFFSSISLLFKCSMAFIAHFATPGLAPTDILYLPSIFATAALNMA